MMALRFAVSRARVTYGGSISHILRCKGTGLKKATLADPVEIFKTLHHMARQGNARHTSNMLKQLRPHLRLASRQKKPKITDNTDAPPTAVSEDHTPDTLAGIPHEDLTRLLNTLLLQCTSKEAVTAMFSDLTRDGIRPDIKSYTTVMRTLLQPPTKWDDLKLILGIREKMVAANMKDNTETISVLLALAALQTPLRHEKYMEIWEQLKSEEIELHPKDYVYFFDMPPTSQYEPFILEVVQNMRENEIDESKIDRYYSKWKPLQQKYDSIDEDDEYEYDDEPEEADAESKKGPEL
jgi:hypothetical protein